MQWNGKTRGREKTNLGTLQGTPLALIIFMIWMAPIIRKMEIVIKEEALCDNKLFSYVDDLYVKICNSNRIQVKMELLLKSIDTVVNQVAMENHLPLVESKHETLV